jgi:hypothetical protein
VVIVVGCALGGAFTSAKPQPDRLPGLAPGAAGAPATGFHGLTPTKEKYSYLPASSCAASSCHGGGRIGKTGSEHSTWAPELVPPAGQSDPHSKAYQVLFNEVSVQMGKLLKLTPHTDSRCLTCHAVDRDMASVPRDPKCFVVDNRPDDPATTNQARAEGVGCSGCHGPAQKWINVHYLPEWQTYSNEKKWKDFGFLPTKNIVSRTLNCVTCHVGDADHDVNHDFIAAGHPRLAFEPARFHYQPDYRKHWTEKIPQPDFEIRLWVVGQVATLRSAAKLLEARADRALKNDENTPWPEFSGLSCYACHQKVGEKDLRGVAGTNPRPAGVPGWEVWSNTGMEIAAEYCGAAYPGLTLPDLKVALKAVVDLSAVMNTTRPAAPGKVRPLAAKAVEELDKWLLALQNAEDTAPKPLSKETTQKLALAMANKLAANAVVEKDGKPLLKDHDWDALAANYLGCAAMYHATREADRTVVPPWGAKLETLRDNLAFPRTERFNSPANLTQARLKLLRDNFIELRDATAPRGGN